MLKFTGSSTQKASPLNMSDLFSSRSMNYTLRKSINIVSSIFSTMYLYTSNAALREKQLTSSAASLLLSLHTRYHLNSGYSRLNCVLSSCAPAPLCVECSPLPSFPSAPGLLNNAYSVKELTSRTVAANNLYSDSVLSLEECKSVRVTCMH